MNNPRTEMAERLEVLIEQAAAGRGASRADALWILEEADAESGGVDLLPLLDAAGRVRRRWWGRRVQVHILNNVQNGACPEDCGYCGQAKTSEAPIQAYKLKPKEEIIAEAGAAREGGAFRYCMVLSGRGPSDRDIDHMADCIREVKERFGLETCLSSGLLDDEKARRLKEAGLDRLNHNLNTSERHYPAICSTHTYGDRMATLAAARGAGLQLCTGLIVGMGESFDDLIDVAEALQSVEAESIPMNFLVPIPGNTVVDPTCNGRPLSPELCLRTLCMMRFMNPRAEVRVAAGREVHLRSLQALALQPANSLFVDGYLLTRGSGPTATLRMIRDAGCEIVMQGSWPESLRAAWECDDPGEPGDEGPAAGTAVLKQQVVSARKLARLSVNGVDAAS